ncbi:glutamate-ammonia-ligase adenylyltransferase, partial [bacterium]|nr:glutamate-ammonia-ligase adenylyltransferase [bacterium]
MEDPALLDQLRLSVMLCKQFTFFLDRAPNPLDAMSRFEQLVQSVLRLPERGEWISLLSNPLALKDMARLLGTSEFLWEDVIRLHYESLLPMLKPHVERQPIYAGESTIESRLRTAVHSASGYEAKKTALNEFKDNEIFLIDLDHILEQSDLLKLSKQLTLLVEAVVRVTLNIVTEELTRRHGVPLTVGNIPAQCAVFGLGKLGGVALGYASDIELLIIYSDSGHTNGESPISNSEFFTELVREIRHFIVAKRSGIFDIDLRLRPYGNDGPLAVSVENFCRYFGNDGSAHLYEKLALVRMRWIAGDAQLGQRVEKLRDEFVYNASQLDFKELWELRRKQFEEKTVSGLVNAKFSPGALVDLEYTVQALQVIGGRSVPELRTPRIRDALIALRKAGVLEVS